MTTLADTPRAPTLLARLAAPFRALGWFLMQLAEAGPRMEALKRLNETSDETLAAHGTTREAQIRRILGPRAYV